MIKILVAFSLGIIVATIGFGGLTQIADKHLNTAKDIIKESVK